MTPKRGTFINPPNRFEPIELVREAEDESEQTAVSTRYFRDNSRTILACNESPDVGFRWSLNPYRGCEHGCIYCYARPTHEFFGLSSGLDFESKIFVKTEAAQLLKAALHRPDWNGETIAIGGVTDPYQPIERRLKITRQCLEVLLAYRNPTIIVTKNFLVTRDVDLLGELAQFQAAGVYVSITTLDRELAGRMEPRTSVPERRLAAIEALSRAGVPTGVLVAPVIPGLTDHELPTILQAARQAGAKYAGYIVLRLPHQVKTLFVDWLERHYPEKKGKVLHRIEQIRGGKLNDPRFGSRMRGEGIFAQQVAHLFTVTRKKLGYSEAGMQLSSAQFRRPGGQLSLF
ncbi:MAG: PA0069 family radical SAM protein [Calditrichaeota bacterium]|nr:MAG: PA0069 family radical SAM protein [Calditrichota bacterium]